MRMPVMEYPAELLDDPERSLPGRKMARDDLGGEMPRAYGNRVLAQFGSHWRGSS